MRTAFFLRALAAGCLALLLIAPAALAQQLDTTKLAGMQARSIGPAGMSGRVTAIAAVHDNPDVIYIGTASGGLWKSTSGGIGWEPIFDDQPVASIGSIALYQKSPDILYVGTGEGNPRNSQTNGNGMYKSLDGGRTWQHLGLDDTRNIHRVIVHPDNPDIVYVGAIGAAWGDSEARGVYKTTDGGATWEKILYANDRTGVGDLVMDPANPNKLIAAMWEYRRWPWFFKSGGEGSGLYVTHDGGKTWTERTDEDGLPKGELGRIGVAIAPSNPQVVYALVESQKNALYRSDDGGFKWRKVADQNIGNRPFYYGEIHVDTGNENRLYNLHSTVTVSNDGGKTFETLIPWTEIHPDHHAWWGHPDDPNFLMEGNDGGLAISRDRGATWRFVENLPLAQFYHISVDNEFPYNVYGGMQDNGSWKGPSQVWRAGGIRNAYWQEVAFGDGFDVVPDPTDARYGYAMWQGGNLLRYDSETGQSKYIRPTHPDPGVTLRFNWNAGIAQDPFDPNTIYYGSQFLHKSTNQGDEWDVISPDLTTNDPEKQQQLESGGLTYDVTQAENFTTIVAIAPSPRDRNVVWVGTDDGNVQLTRDGGQTWTNTVGNIRGVPAGTWVPQIRASHHEAGTAYVVFEDHRRNNWEPYVYRTRDYGRTWTRLADADKVWGFALALVEDPVTPNLLFLGTEFGLYVSIDAGQTWTKWTHGFPTVSTMDLALHPREHDLVIGTFGRAAYILDDIRPLRALAQEGTGLLDAPLHLFEIPDAYQVAYQQAAGTRFMGAAMYTGENRPYGAMLSYVVNAPEKADDAEADSSAGTPAPKEVKIEILENGEVIRTFDGPAEPGLNRTTWTLNRRGLRFPSANAPRADADEPGGAAVLPGTYTVRLTYGDHQDSTTVAVHSDPRLDISDAALAAQRAHLDRWETLVEVASDAMDRLRDARATVDLFAKELKDRDDDAAKDARDKGKAAKDTANVLMERFIGRQNVQGIYRDPTTLNALLGTASTYIQAGNDAPGQAANRAFAQVEAALRATLADINAFFAGDWAAYRQAIEAANVELFESYAPLRLEE